MEITGKIQEGNPRLTRSQKKALRYIIDNYEESIFLPASSLARKIGVSEATIIRLAQALGFNGFPEFKRNLQSLIKERISTVSRLEHTVGQIKDEGDVLFKVFQEDMENLTHTLKEIPIDIFKRVIRQIQKADRIFIIGLRSSYALAIFFGIVLRYLNKDVRVLEPGHGEFWDYAVSWRKDDLVIGISFPRYTRMTVEALKYAKERGIPSIGITDHPLAPLAQHCNLVLTARCAIDSYIESFTAPLSLINAIVTAVSIQDSKQTLRALKKIENIWEEKDIYINP